MSPPPLDLATPGDLATAPLPPTLHGPLQREPALRLPLFVQDVDGPGDVLAVLDAGDDVGRGDEVEAGGLGDAADVGGPTKNDRIDFR